VNADISRNTSEGAAMEESTNNGQDKSIDAEFQKFIGIRIVGGIIIAAVLLWGTFFLIEFFSSSEALKSVQSVHLEKSPVQKSEPDHYDASPPLPETNEMETTQPIETLEVKSQEKSQVTGEVKTPKARGVQFVEALIKPLDYELNKRLWGWRPNDILAGKFGLTDNVNEFQLGTLEVTRRATARLTENISRTGSTAALNPYLEQAMNGFMMNADRYFFPSSEAQYNDSLQKLSWYKDQLEAGGAFFYNRPDNLIPLLNAFEELLGSCDENLVKAREENGQEVSTFRADNYYYYAKGVAHAMAIILESVGKDFDKTLEMRNGKEILRRAIEACHHAGELEPWLFVTEADLCGIFANHRANMAAPVSHARFYVGLLAEALST